METLNTERLLLRDYTLADAEDFYSYCSDPDVGIHSGWTPHQSLDESREMLQHQIDAGNIWAVCEREGGKNIGALWLRSDFRRARSMEDCRVIGYILAKPYWGKGLMTEAVQEVLRHAFAQLGLKMVSTYRFAYNQRSGRVMEKAGFVYEGTLRHATARFDGALLDVMCYSLTKEEWQAKAAEREVE